MISVSIISIVFVIFASASIPTIHALSYFVIGFFVETFLAVKVLHFTTIMLKKVINHNKYT